SQMGSFLPWFLETEVSSILTTINEERVPLPTDFLGEVEQDALWYYNPTAATSSPPVNPWIQLRKDDLDFLRGDQVGSGPPQMYAFQGKYFRIFPLPDMTYTLKMIYYAQDAVISLTTENKWLKNIPWLLIGDAGSQLAISLRDDKAFNFFNNMMSLQAA